MKIESKIIFGIAVLNLAISIFLLNLIYFKSENDYIELHYKSEAHTLVSPHTLREQIHENRLEYIIVDTREWEDYLAGHIIGAYHIAPGDNMIQEFRNLKAENLDKDILIYCYTDVCMRGRKIGKELAENGIYVKELNIGFNNWKNYWQAWNYEKEWGDINIDDYIQVGQERGVFSPKEAGNNDFKNCSPEDGFGC